jgi:hypothetical protein
MACEIGNGVGVFQSRRSIDAEHRLEAYTTLRLRLADPDRASFKTSSEQYCRLRQELQLLRSAGWR